MIPFISFKRCLSLLLQQFNIFISSDDPCQLPTTAMFNSGKLEPNFQTSTPSLFVNRIQKSVDMNVTGSFNFNGCALFTAATSYRLST